jgi:hypothetical protein
VFDKKPGSALSLGAVAAGVGDRKLGGNAHGQQFWKKAAIRPGRVRVEQQQTETSFIAPPDGMSPHP